MSASNKYPGTIKMIMPLLSAEPQTAKQIWQRADMWAPMTIRHALNEMARLGLARKTIGLHLGGIGSTRFPTNFYSLPDPC